MIVTRALFLLGTLLMCGCGGSERQLAKGNAIIGKIESNSAHLDDWKKLVEISQKLDASYSTELKANFYRATAGSDIIEETKPKLSKEEEQILEEVLQNAHIAYDDRYGVVPTSTD